MQLFLVLMVLYAPISTRLKTVFHQGMMHMEDISYREAPNRDLGFKPPWEEDLRRQARAIDERLTSCSLMATHLEESLEHGVLHAFTCNGVLTKIEATDYMETGKVRMEFYLAPALFYIRSEEIRYNRSIGGEDAEFGKLEDANAYVEEVLDRPGKGTGLAPDGGDDLRSHLRLYQDLLANPDRFAHYTYRAGAWRTRDELPSYLEPYIHR